uniref:Uncharacterized protein n=1 Tax=Ditylenchus dipsaci TaxID=166011 RepID=A0A915DLW4_9BILA
MRRIFVRPLKDFLKQRRFFELSTVKAFSDRKQSVVDSNHDAVNKINTKLSLVKSEFPSVPVASRSFADVILDALLRHSKEQPNRPAMINAEDENDFVTYEQLYIKSHTIAAFLESLKFGRGDIACTVLPNCWQFLAAFIGCSIQGGSISGANHNFIDRELAQQFIDSKCSVVFCSDIALDKVIKACENAPSVKKIIVVPLLLEASKLGEKKLPLNVVHFSTVLSATPNLNKQSLEVVVDKDVLLLPYSSGTTGAPKGVMLTHKSTMMNCFNYHFHHKLITKFDPNWEWKTGHQCFILPLYHIYGFGIAINCLLSGGCGILLKQFDGDIFCRTMQNYKINHGLLVPPVLVFLAKSPVVSKYDLSAMKFIMTGAAPAGSELIEEVKKRIPSVSQISQGYGMTEGSMASHLPVYGMDNTSSCGRLMSNLEMKVSDVETGQPVPIGEVGQICIRGPTTMLGYLNKPEATAQTIDKEGWLMTGDIGYLDSDGWTYIVDRLKELIKVRGFQVAPAELEDLLLSHKGIRDVAVVGIADNVSGEVPKAFVVKDNPDLTVNEVLAFVRDRVSPHKELKGGVAFVEEIPKVQQEKF